MAAVLRRQRVLHRGGRRPLRHGLGRLRRRRRVVGRVRLRDALRQRRPPPHLQRPRRHWSAAPTPTRRSTPRPPSGPILPGGCLRHRDGHRQLLPRRRATRTRSRSTTPSATRCGATRWTATPGGAPRWPTSRATGSSPWSRAPSTAADRARSGPSTRPRAAPIWHANVPAPSIGSVTTADLTAAATRTSSCRPTRASTSSTADRRADRRTSTTGRATPAPIQRLRLPERAARHGRCRRVHRHHGGGLLRHAERRRQTCRASCSTSRCTAPWPPGSAKPAGGPSSTTTRGLSGFVGGGNPLGGVPPARPRRRTGT